jgi:regulator of protease activity HflC (stomatin/prohibitin superfamily)
MTSQSPAAQLEARANRENAKLLKAQDELHVVAVTIKHSDLPPEVKLRLMGALRHENDLLLAEQERVAGLRKAAEISRSKQWVTSGDDQ